MSISAVSASDANDTVIRVNDANQTIISSPGDEIPEHPDLIDREYTYVYQSTLDNFFNEGVLDSKFEGMNLIFSGSFENIGQLKIDCDNITITGDDAILKNTAFMLSGSQITLKNLNFNLDKPVVENDGAAILVTGSDIDLINVNINYVVPKDVEAYAIFADGYDYGAMEHLRIINSTVYFEGHNDNVRKYNCALKLSYAYDSIIENTTIVTSLPLKEIDYTDQGADLDSAYVYSVGIEGCGGFIFNNNTVISEVNKRPAVEYPTLDCFVISKSDGVTLSNNSIYMTDFVTYPGSENYLYGVEIHNLKNLWIVNNSISMVTTGGKLALGTAYPIQISGPIEGVVIEYNDLYSFSNGPNIGIYSQCYYGETYLSIRYNKINVTGLAGTHDWALVTGIESQDTFAEIFNNEIEVHSVADVGINDNLYAISYRQSISGPNTFDIENNVAVTDGYYAVYILNSEYSSIINNTLISFNDNVQNGDDAYRLGFRHHISEDNYDNRVIRAVDYFSQRNEVDNANVIDIDEYASSNVIDTTPVSARTGEDNVNSNPFAPSFTDLPETGHGPSTGYVDDGSPQATINVMDGSTPENADSTDDNQNTFDRESDVYASNGETQSSNDNDNNNVNVKSDGNANAVNADANNLVAVSNSSSTSVGISNNPVSGSQSAASSAGSSQSVSKKAYEIEEMTEDEKFIPSVFIVIFALILLVVGYKRKSEDIQ